ncbi:hypothetical protein [uncultured Methanobrevibacter sp.]|uniref:hypothetical protein n=1 Tax=uncultured Methanobrevibacter sp. TaxID=253161 RepID=UPI0025E63836|nr:hypothetical protein [uncultured Methanobrevibacter sp.]
MKSWFKKNWVFVALAISIGAFWLFKDFLNGNSQALLVLITAIYVIATINISNANIRSAEATREQIIESKRQFEETKRLEYMPCFEIYFDKMEAGTGTSIELTDKQTGIIHNLITKYRIENISKGTAINVNCRVISAIKDTELITWPIVPAQKEIAINCLILADKGYFIDNSLPFSVVISYDDIMNNHYEQNVELEFIENNPRWIWVKSVGAPQLNNKGVS